MKMTPIRIIPYDGHRAGVKPLKVVDESRTLDVLEIERAWIETGEDPKSPVIHTFIVHCTGGRIYRVRHHSEDGWSAVRQLPTAGRLSSL